MVGMLAAAKAGHDKDTLYIIIEETDEYVWLTDGKYRPVAKPKKKKKHIQPVKTGIAEALAEKIRSEQTIYNEEIKFAIKIRAK